VVALGQARAVRGCVADSRRRKPELAGGARPCSRALDAGADERDGPGPRPPGPVALALALDCATHGWRPVPLFNSCPGPEALVDNESIRAGLTEGAWMLREMNLPAAAPPAFVLDSHRTEGQPAPKRFDNRWVVFPQDFPSAARLVSGGLRRVCLVQHGRREPRSDLAHVLLRWQQAGLEILALDLAGEASPAPIAVAKPSRFRALGYRALVALGLRKNSAGGFGALVPSPGAGGGGVWA